jgi:ribokinase
MGAAGVFFATPDEQGFVPPFQVAAVDSVAAGDCFNGGLAFALARGDGMESAVRFAAACGALATTRPGAAAAAPDLAEVARLLA